MANTVTLVPLQCTPEVFDGGAAECLPARPLGRPALSTVRELESCDDDELMRRAAADDRRAFELLIRRHQSALRAYCGRMCGSGAGDEVVQEVFVSLWNARAAYEPRGTFRSYIFTIADRRSRNVMRSGARSRKVGSGSEAPLEQTPLEELMSAERRARLERTLAKLPADQRSAILLRYGAGLEYEEIARITRRPCSTIRARVFAGLARLRRLTGARGEL
jgi:RNA polymerase sigma-70 factor, ECF subfamily